MCTASFNEVSFCSYGTVLLEVASSDAFRGQVKLFRGEFAVLLQLGRTAVVLRYSKPFLSMPPPARDVQEISSISLVESRTKTQIC